MLNENVFGSGMRIGLLINKKFRILEYVDSTYILSFFVRQSTFCIREGAEMMCLTNARAVIRCQTTQSLVYGYRLKQPAQVMDVE